MPWVIDESTDWYAFFPKCTYGFFFHIHNSLDDCLSDQVIVFSGCAHTVRRDYTESIIRAGNRMASFLQSDWQVEIKK